MIEAVYTSNTGLNASQALLDASGNNLANINTTSFKANRAAFQDLLSAPVAGQILKVGRGTRLSSTSKLFGEGPLQNTGLPLDVAIDGNGFFQLTLPGGAVRYTHDGSFRVDPTGRLVAADGSLVQPPIVIPPRTTAINIGPDGTVTVTTADAPTSPRTVGQLTLVNFANPPGLTSVGNNQYVASLASGKAVTAVPGQGGTGLLRQGFLEGSNVNAATELVNLLIAQRSFAFNSQAIQVANQMLTSATSLVP